MKKLFNRKLFIILLIIIICFGVFFFAFKGSNIKKNDILKVNYENSNNIKISNISKKYEFNKKIIVENDSDDSFYYSIFWENVDNSFLHQSNLLYSLKGDNYRSVEFTQVPVVDSCIFTKIRINAHEKHTYDLKIWYKSSSEVIDESNSVFNGNIDIKKISDGSTT